MQWERPDLVALSWIFLMRKAFHNSPVIDTLDQSTCEAGLSGYSRVNDTGIAKDGFTSSFYLSLLVTGNYKMPGSKGCLPYSAAIKVLAN